jgi:hypothetical protein
MVASPWSLVVWVFGGTWCLVFGLFCVKAINQLEQESKEEPIRCASPPSSLQRSAAPRKISMNESRESISKSLNQSINQPSQPTNQKSYLVLSIQD